MKPQYFVGSRYRASLAIFAFAVSVAGQLYATPLDSVTIHWLAPPDCPAESTLRAQLLRDLRGSKAGRRLDAEIQVVSVGGQRWQSHLRIRDDNGKTERVLSARRCDALLSVTSLVLATMIDPDLASDLPPASDGDPTIPGPGGTANASDSTTESASNVSNGLVATPPNATPGVPAPQPPSPQSAQPSSSTAAVAPSYGGSLPVTTPLPNQAGFRAAPTRQTAVVSSTRQASPISTSKRALSMAGALSGGFDSGSLPNTTAVLDARIAIELDRFRVEAALGWWLPQRATLSVSPATTVNGRFGMTAVGARGCLRLWQAASASVLSCVGLELERWRGQGDQANVARSNSSVLWGTGVTAGALGLLKFSRWLSLRGSGEAVVFLDAPTFGFLAGTTRMEVFQPDKLSLRGQMGLELDFW